MAVVNLKDKVAMVLVVDNGLSAAGAQLYKKIRSGARDDAMAMQYIIPGWKYDPKQPSIGRK